MAMVLSTHGAFPFEKAIKKAKVAGKTGTGWDDSYIKNAHAGHVTIFFIDAVNKADALSKIAQSKPYAKNINNVYYFGDESERAITRAIEKSSPNFIRKENVNKLKKSELRQIIREEIESLLKEVKYKVWIQNSVSKYNQSPTATDEIKDKKEFSDEGEAKKYATQLKKKYNLKKAGHTWYAHGWELHTNF
jgi:hypothetical protein